MSRDKNVNYQQYFKRARESMPHFTRAISAEATREDLTALSEAMCNNLTPEQSERLSKLAAENIKILADNGLLNWRARLNEIGEPKITEVEQLSSSLAEQMNLTVMVVGSEDAVQTQFAELQNIEPDKLEVLLKKMLIPSSTANISQTAAFGFLSILDRENGDADQWLIAAATTEKLINRESKRIAAEMATNLNPAEVAELFGSLFRPSYLPTAESTQPVQYILAISYKSEQ